MTKFQSGKLAFNQNKEGTTRDMLNIVDEYKREEQSGPIAVTAQQICERQV
jgi:hypothetical protein